jgi:hypothetical protein
MARAGRKRKDVPRLAGRRDWRHLLEDPSLLTKWSRYRDRIGELGGNPKLASQAGKMHYLRKITALEAEAAERWTKLLAEYDRLILGMARTPSGGSLERMPSADWRSSSSISGLTPGKFRAEIDPCQPAR